MIRLTAALTMSAVVAAASAEAQTPVITRGGSRAVRHGAGGEFHGQRSGRDAVRGTRSVSRQRRIRHVRAPRPDGVALPSPRPDPHRHGRHGPRPAMGRPHGGDSGRRRGQDSRRPEALAWGVAAGIHDAHRAERAPRRHRGGVDGEGERRARANAARTIAETEGRAFARGSHDPGPSEPSRVLRLRSSALAVGRPRLRQQHAAEPSRCPSAVPQPRAHTRQWSAR